MLFPFYRLDCNVLSKALGHMGTRERDKAGRGGGLRGRERGGEREGGVGRESERKREREREEERKKEREGGGR